MADASMKTFDTVNTALVDAGHSPAEIIQWWTSSKGDLEGKFPIDLLDSRPADVLKVAETQRDGGYEPVEEEEVTP